MGALPESVWCEHGRWYHTDECWADVYGPFDDEAAARAAMAKYVDWLENGPFD